MTETTGGHSFPFKYKVDICTGMPKNSGYNTEYMLYKDYFKPDLI